MMRIMETFLVTFVVGFALGVGWSASLWYESEPVDLEECKFCGEQCDPWIERHVYDGGLERYCYRTHSVDDGPLCCHQDRIPLHYLNTNTGYYRINDDWACVIQGVDVPCVALEWYLMSMR